MVILYELLSLVEDVQEMPERKRMKIEDVEYESFQLSWEFETRLKAALGAICRDNNLETGIINMVCSFIK